MVRRDTWAGGGAWVEERKEGVREGAKGEGVQRRVQDVVSIHMVSQLVGGPVLGSQ